MTTLTLSIKNTNHSDINIIKHTFHDDQHLKSEDLVRKLMDYNFEYYDCRSLFSPSETCHNLSNTYLYITLQSAYNLISNQTKLSLTYVRHDQSLNKGKSYGKKGKACEEQLNKLHIDIEQHINDNIDQTYLEFYDLKIFFEKYQNSYYDTVVVGWWHDLKVRAKIIGMIESQIKDLRQLDEKTRFLRIYDKNEETRFYAK